MSKTEDLEMESGTPAPKNEPHLASLVLAVIVAFMSVILVVFTILQFIHNDNLTKQQAQLMNDVNSLSLQHGNLSSQQRSLSSEQKRLSLEQDDLISKHHKLSSQQQVLTSQQQYLTSQQRTFYSELRMLAIQLKLYMERNPPIYSTSEDEQLGSGSGGLPKFEQGIYVSMAFPVPIDHLVSIPVPIVHLDQEREYDREREYDVPREYDEHIYEFKKYMNSWLVTKFVPSIYTIVLLVALPLNIMAIIVFLVKVKVKNPAVVFLLNLAAADVLFVSILPFYIVYRFSGNNWLMGEGMCRFATAAFFSNMHVSILLMTSISVDRFLAVVYPVQSLTWRTVKRAWIVCCCIWVISMVSIVPILIVQQTRPHPGLKITTCSDVKDAELFERFQVNYVFPFFISILYFLPLIITTFCYIAIVHSLRAPGIKGDQKKSRAVLLSVVVLCVFVLCFGPANVIWFMHFLKVSNHGGNFLYIVYIISVSVSSVSCCLDPLIYYYASSEWQAHAYSLLGCKREQTPSVNPKTQETT